MAELGATAYLVDGGDLFIAKRVSGTVRDDYGNPVKRDLMTVTLSNRITGLPGMIQKGSSRADGTYELGGGLNDTVDVIAFDDDAGTSYNHQILGRVTPT